ncbi:MAG TPA: serine/threonine-protein kinase [Chroococcidiopsis sp.]
MTVNYCCNPTCPNPQNPDGATFCLYCGSRLLLGDRYGAFSQIGGGSLSTTYLAVDTYKLIDRRCIIKGFVAAGKDMGHELEYEREVFRQEAARLGEVGRHPQLPDLYAYFERGDRHYLVQEFINGRNLLQQVQEDGTFSEGDIRSLLEDFLPVLQFLHDHQIIHRDIKPSNLIRRTRDRRIVLVDYGAAKQLTPAAMLETGTTIGSAEYTAPEQLYGKAIFASDLYSLGVTCIHLLTGLRPFELFDSQSRRWFWRSVAGPINNELANLIDRLLQADVGDRFQSVGDVIQHGIQCGIQWGNQGLGISSTEAAALPVTQIPPPPAPIWSAAGTVQTGAAVNAVAVAADGRWAVSGGDEGTVQCWQPGQSLPLVSLKGHHGAIASLAITPDGRRIASGGWDQTIRLWDPTSGKETHVLSGHTGVVAALTISSDGRLLVSGGTDRQLCLWDLASGALLHQFTEHRAAITAIALGSDNQTLVSADASGLVIVWQVGTRERLRSLSSHSAALLAIALTPDSQTVISSSVDMQTQVRDLHTGGLYHRLSGHLLPVSAIAASPDGQTLITGSHDSSLAVWAIATGKSAYTLYGHSAPINAIALSADGGLLVSGSRDQTLRFWRQQRA